MTTLDIILVFAIPVALLVGWILCDVIATKARMDSAMLDFTPAAARGELDLQWDFPKARR